MSKKSTATTIPMEPWFSDSLRANPELEQLTRDHATELDIAQLVYDLRTERKLSQKAFAELVGTTQPVISRLENADYKGHSMGMLKRIAEALNCDLRVIVVPRPAIVTSSHRARKSA